MTQEEQNEVIRNLWERRYSDSEIAKVLEVSPRTVLRRRRKLGLEAHEFGGTEKWGPDAREKMSKAAKDYWNSPLSAARHQRKRG